MAIKSSKTRTTSPILEDHMQYLQCIPRNLFALLALLSRFAQLAQLALLALHALAVLPVIHVLPVLPVHISLFPCDPPLALSGNKYLLFHHYCFMTIV